MTECGRYRNALNQFSIRFYVETKNNAGEEILKTWNVIPKTICLKKLATNILQFVSFTYACECFETRNKTMKCKKDTSIRSN